MRGWRLERKRWSKVQGLPAIAFGDGGFKVSSDGTADVRRVSPRPKWRLARRSPEPIEGAKAGPRSKACSLPSRLVSPEPPYSGVPPSL